MLVFPLASDKFKSPWLISALDYWFPISPNYYRDLDGDTIWPIPDYGNLKFYRLFHREKLLELTGIEYYQENHARAITRDSNKRSIFPHPRRYYGTFAWCSRIMSLKGFFARDSLYILQTLISRGKKECYKKQMFDE